MLITFEILDKFRLCVSFISKLCIIMRELLSVLMKKYLRKKLVSESILHFVKFFGK